MLDLPERPVLKGATHVVREILSGSNPGPIFSRFEILGELGNGAAAEVYRVRDRTLHRIAALKVLRETPSSVLRERFRREAEAIAGLSHPNLVAIHDAGEENGRMYLVLELVEGRPFSEVLGERRLGLRELVGILEKAARGLAAAHKEGIVHRDFKPANVLVTPSGSAKVTDFGLAHLMRTESALTHQGEPLGTPLYMAPEQVRGSGAPISPRTDVYALGATLYEILTGRPPHEGPTLGELYGRILAHEPLPPRRLAPQVPRALEAICRKALEKDPGRRYSDAEEMAEDLARFLAGEAPVARPEAALWKAWRRMQGRPLRWAVLALAPAAALLAAVLARPNEEANVAKNLILQKLQGAENTLVEWRRERREVSDFSSAVHSAVEDARRKLEARHYAEAAVRADQALLVTHLEHLIRRVNEMADHLARQGRDVSSCRRASEETRAIIRQERSERYPEGVRAVDRAMQSLCSLFQEQWTSKVEQIQAGVERRKRAGGEPRGVARIMEEFPPLARAGRVFEADSVLDRALKALVDSP